MKVNSREMIRKIRMDIGVSQEDLAEQLYISQRQLSRIETGEKNLDIWQFMTLMELAGLPTEDFWLLYMDTKDYDDYRTYKRIKGLVWEDKFSEARVLLEELEKTTLSNHPFIRQFIAHYKIETDSEMPREQVIEELTKVMHMSKPSFDESKISEYRLNYNEIGIITGIAVSAAALGDVDRSVALHEAIISNRKNIRASDDDKARLLPNLMTNLTTILGRAGRYRESLKYCYEALDVCRLYGKFRQLPSILVNIASGYRLLGEEESVYRPYLNRAYQCALGIGDKRQIDAIKKTAEESFGIKDL